MNQDDFEIDESAFKGAVQRAWGDERAPQRLCGRVGRLMATAGSIEDATVATAGASAAERWRSRAYSLAAAAVLALSVGLLVLYYQGTFDRVPGGRATAYNVIVPSKTDVPLTLARSMVATHSACGKLIDHHHTVENLDGNSYAALTVRLTADLGFPVVARGIGSGWTFKGAGECDVAELRGAHLLFARDDQMISVFSLPSSCMAGVAPGAEYEGTVDNHPVAGFARPGTVYAIVGSSDGAEPPVSLEAVTAIRDALLSACDIGCATDDPEALLFFDQ